MPSRGGVALKLSCLARLTQGDLDHLRQTPLTPLEITLTVMRAKVR